MKRSFVYAVSLLLLGWAGTLQAQSGLGIKGGVSYGSSYGSPEQFNDEDIESIDLAVGYQFGITSQHQLSDGVGLLVELLYESRQGRKDVDFTVNPAPGSPLALRGQVEFDNQFNYLNLPVLFTFGSGVAKFYAGPSFGYLLSAKSDVTTTYTTTPSEAGGANGLPPNGTTESEIDFIDDYDEPYINRFNVAGNVGVQFGLTEGVFLDFRVFHTLTDITNDDEDLSIIDRAIGVPAPAQRDDNDNSFGGQLSVGIRF